MSLSNGASQRVGSSSLENKTLRETVAQLQQELQHSKAETQKVTDQLNCLIMLVKRTWRGDKSAAFHVANIIGAAPPELQEKTTNEMQVVLCATPKSRALNNWAMLTVGLLNKNYKLQEEKQQEQQVSYLYQRTQYLEEQLLYLKDEKMKQPRLSPPASLDSHQAVPPQEYRLTDPHGGPRRERVRSAGKKKPLIHHLYGQPARGGSAGLTMKDLVIDGSVSSHHSNQAFDGLCHMSQVGKKTTPKNVSDANRIDMDYDDHRRYSQLEIYDLEKVVGPHTMQRLRPISGNSLKDGDQRRARAKSASGLGKSGRPLKYETTRPMSAPIKEKSVKGASKKNYNNKNHTSGFFMTNTEKMPDEDDEDMTQEQNEAGRDAESAVKVTVTRGPDSISRLVDDLEKMDGMEQDFQKATISLQKKLGITNGALVY